MALKSNIPVIEKTKLFAALKYGQLFTVDDSGRIYCKTIMTDSPDGGFCNAVCVNPLAGQEMYVKCPSEAICTIIDTEKIFGLVERC